MPGLEIGFHVPPFSRGPVITRLGRNTDIILRESYSAVHVAFEVHPETQVVMLSIRAKRLTPSVTVTTVAQRAGDEPQQVTGDCVIFYGTDYEINIATYAFRLVWRTVSSVDNIGALKSLTMQGYNDSMDRLKDVRSRDRSLLDTEIADATQSWYMTRLQSSKAPLVTEFLKIPRQRIGKGGFGEVFRAVDAATGNPFAIKVVKLTEGGNSEVERATLHREMKILERLSHVGPFFRSLGAIRLHPVN
jgi:hypothetical protein